MLRMTQNTAKKKAVREVVDGQQRIRSVLDFIGGDFKLSKTLRAPWAGRRFGELSADEQDRILRFKFSCEVFHGISDRQVLEVFCRLNTNGVPLNKQELRNGQWFGHFKQAAFDLAVDYLEFWRTHRIFSETSIARMLEVELTSELLIAGLAGMQDKKKSIDLFYQDLEETYPDQQRDERRFNEVMTTISNAFGQRDLAESEFHRPPLFYTLYCVVFHHLFGLPSVQRQSPKKKLSLDDRESLREAVIRLSDVIVTSKDPASNVPGKYQSFVAACLRQTDNISPRKTRFNTLFEEAF